MRKHAWGLCLLLISMLAVSSSFPVNASVSTRLPFDPVRDFAGVGSIATSDILLVVNPTVPARTVKEFIALAGSRPGKLTYASSGTGGSLHLAAELLSLTSGILMVHGAYLRDEITKWRGVVAAAKLPLQ